MHAARPDDRVTRGLRLLRNALLAAAVVSITSPWTSGAYTLWQQARLSSAFGHVAAADVSAGRRAVVVAPPRSRGATEPARPFARALDGWEREDAAAWRRLPDGGPFARLRIPHAGVDITVVKGVSVEDLRRGPGWLPDTALPGPSGNVGISGHRTTWLAPFRDVDRLVPGDAIRLDSPYRTYMYRVTGRTFVGPHDTGVFAPTAAPTLTLTACHPPYSDQFRIVIRARLVAVTRR